MLFSPSYHDEPDTLKFGGSRRTTKPPEEGRGATLLLALVGQKPHLLSLPLEHATQKGTFLLPAVPIAIVVGSLSLECVTGRAPFALEHLAQELDLTTECCNRKIDCVLLLCVSTHSLVRIWIAQGTIDPLELGWIDEVATKLIACGGEVTFLDRTTDRRAMLADELSCLCSSDRWHVRLCAMRPKATAHAQRLAGRTSTGQQEGDAALACHCSLVLVYGDEKRRKAT
jgi:hypothetical protein